MNKEEWEDYKKLSGQITEKLDNTSTYESWLIIQEYIDRCQQENKQLKEHIEKYEHYCKTTGIEELMKENKKYKEVIEKIKTRYIDYYGTTKEVNDDYVLRSVLKEISDLVIYLTRVIERGGII